jgi:protein arginine kinase activator
LGCSQCYETFKEGLIPLLKKIHGSTQHAGSSPKKKTKKKRKFSGKIQELKEQLDEAIKKEDFEEAARLRDKIKELKKGDNKGKGEY